MFEKCLKGLAILRAVTCLLVVTIDLAKKICSEKNLPFGMVLFVFI